MDLDNAKDKKFTKSELQELYNKGDMADKKIFAEMRNNVMLNAGYHYKNSSNEFIDRTREKNKISAESSRLKLIRNHTQKLVNITSNNIMRYCDGVTILPQNEFEPGDQKAAEMNKSVWKSIQEDIGDDEATEMYIDSFTTIGEMVCYMKYDPMGGKKIRDEQSINPETGQMENLPIFEGKFIDEEILAFNLRRHHGCLRMKDSPGFIIDRSHYLKDLKEQYKDNRQIAEKIQKNESTNFFAFDPNTQSYRHVEDQVITHEFLFKPCHGLEDGWSIITTADFEILEEGPLPFGIWPLAMSQYSNMATTPRGISKIRSTRPYQVELNRLASKRAENQIATGDDKVFIQSGTKMTEDTKFKGVRMFNISGQPPVVIQGRDASQFNEIYEKEKREFYEVGDIESELQENRDMRKTMDPMGQIYQALKDRKKYIKQIKRAQNFFVERAKIALRLAKECLPDEKVIYMAGRNEQINIPEFKSSEDICYRLTIQPQQDDVDEMLGKQLSIQHALQYVGPQLQPNQIGMILKEMPFLNKSKMFRSFTRNEDKAENLILALDRGQYLPATKFDDPGQMAEALSARMSEPDFQFLNPNIQRLYQLKLEEYDTLLSQQKSEIEQQNAGMIPDKGALIKADFWVPDPTRKNNSVRMLVPTDSMQWLKERLERQGIMQDQLVGLPLGVQAEIGPNKQIPSGSPLPAGGQQQQVMPDNMNQNQNAAPPRTIDQAVNS